MLRTLTLENYRGFRRFEMHDLGRVNLIVGTNNSGKTSILEAIYLLFAKSDTTALWSVLAERGEELHGPDLDNRVVYLDTRHLFHGHSVAPGNEFAITGTDDSQTTRLTATMSNWGQKKDPATENVTPPDSMEIHGDSALEWGSALELLWRGESSEVTSRLKTTTRGGIVTDPFHRPRQFQHLTQPPRVRFVNVNALRPDVVVQLFDNVVLTPEEDLVLRSIRIIEPAIERIAPIGVDQANGVHVAGRGRAGLVLRCTGVKSRLPIGTMGDGIWRLLGLALALADCQGGTLLVDEIDTGLHYSVMEKMWKLVAETSRRLNVQVFATTHSRDCYESLAAVCRDDVTTGSDVTIQRIEREKGRSVAYTEAEIIAAARWGTEVR